MTHILIEIKTKEKYISTISSHFYLHIPHIQCETTCDRTQCVEHHSTHAICTRDESSSADKRRIRAGD